jgi:NAD-dependent deacetylase
MIEVAADIASGADIFLVVGTSMVVYPAAGLIDYVADHVKKYVIDPKQPEILHVPNIEFITEKASVGMEQMKQLLLR